MQDNDAPPDRVEVLKMNYKGRFVVYSVRISETRLSKSKVLASQDIYSYVDL